MHDYRRRLALFIEEHAMPVEKYGHQPRLYQLACDVGASETYDDDVVFAAAWLHDLGVFEGHRPKDLRELAAWDHVAYAVERAPGILRDIGFPGEKIQAVLATIRAHLPASEPESIEGVILRDADILEQLGAIGILRTVAKVGRDTRFVRFSDAINHLEKCLESLPAQLRLPASKQLAVPKTQAMRAFLTAARLEAQGALH